MTTKMKALKTLKSRMSGIDSRGYIYQFPRGHWGWASYGSPIGRDLRESGMIYPEIDCKAQQVELVEW